MFAIYVVVSVLSYMLPRPLDSTSSCCDQGHGLEMMMPEYFYLFYISLQGSVQRCSTCKGSGIEVTQVYYYYCINVVYDRFIFNNSTVSTIIVHRVIIHIILAV